MMFPRLLVLSLLWALTGCTTFEDTRACQGVIATMNPILAEIQAEGASSNTSPTFLRLQASRYRDIADRVSEVPHGTAPLAKAIATVMSEFRRVAFILDDAALARETEQPERYQAARSRLEGSRARLVDLKKQLGRRCGQ